MCQRMGSQLQHELQRTTGVRVCDPVCAVWLFICTTCIHNRTAHYVMCCMHRSRLSIQIAMPRCVCTIRVTGASSDCARSCTPNVGPPTQRLRPLRNVGGQQSNVRIFNRSKNGRKRRRYIGRQRSQRNNHMPKQSQRKHK